MHDGNNIIVNDQSESSFCPIRRNSYDNEINNHGKRLLDICKSAELKILNGRVWGDTLGRPTFHGRNGISVIDYAICDQDLFSNVSNFVVSQPCSISDHSSIITSININTTIVEPESSIENNPLSRLPMQFLWENDSASKFKDFLRSPNLQMLIRDYLDDDNSFLDVNTRLKKVEHMLISAAKRSLKIRKPKLRKKMKQVSNKIWFDKDCRFKRHEVRKLSNQKHRDPLNENLREKCHIALADYKKLLSGKQTEYYNSKITELEKSAENSDKKHFWQCLKWMDDTQKDKDIPLISEERWLNYFRSLHSEKPLNPTQQSIINDLTYLESRKDQMASLDYFITDNEIVTAAKRMKNNKSSFSDKIKNEMIKASLQDMMPVYLKLFNSILISGKMPETWCRGLITPIYKSGDRSDPSNYRGICLKLSRKIVLFYFKPKTAKACQLV